MLRPAPGGLPVGLACGCCRLCVWLAAGCDVAIGVVACQAFGGRRFRLVDERELAGVLGVGGSGELETCVGSWVLVALVCWLCIGLVGERGWAQGRVSRSCCVASSGGWP
jgi:hypothetical protein